MVSRRRVGRVGPPRPKVGRVRTVAPGGGAVGGGGGGQGGGSSGGGCRQGCRQGCRHAHARAKTTCIGVRACGTHAKRAAKSELVRAAAKPHGARAFLRDGGGVPVWRRSARCGGHGRRADARVVRGFAGARRCALRHVLAHARRVRAQHQHQGQGKVSAAVRLLSWALAQLAPPGVPGRARSRWSARVACSGPRGVCVPAGRDRIGSRGECGGDAEQEHVHAHLGYVDKFFLLLGGY